MTNNPTIDGVSRELLTNLLHCGNSSSFIPLSITKQLRALITAPVVERQPSRSVKRFDFDTDEACTRVRFGEQTDGAYVLYEELSNLQSTITQLQARIAELESARGEPVGWIDEPYAGWLKDKSSGWVTVWGTDGTDNPSRRKPSVAVFTAPPAPVAVVPSLWEIRVPDEPQNPESPAEYLYAQGVANRDLLLLREGATVVAEYACLAATAALNGVRK